MKHDENLTPVQRAQIQAHYEDGLPPLSCPLIDQILAIGVSDEIKALLEEVRQINTQLRYSCVCYREELDDLKKEARNLEIAMDSAAEFNRKMAHRASPEEAAKLSERKTVHEWLNDLGIPRKEGDRDLCLLRRVRILCDQTYSLRSELARSKGTIEGMEIGLSLTNAHDT